MNRTAATGGAPGASFPEARPGGAGLVPFQEALRVWVRVGLQSFGGPAGQIAVMHRILVEEKRWISEHRFLHALNYCMLLPGPEAQQLATYIGWLLHGIRGGLVAGTLFVLPGFVTILGLSFLYAGLQGTRLIPSLFFGLKAAVLAVVVEALVRIGRRVLRNGAMLVLAAVAFVGLFVFQVPFPLVILGAAVAGFAGGRLRPSLFGVMEPGKIGTVPGSAATVDTLLEGPLPAHVRPSAGRLFRVAGVHMLLWFAPIGFLAALLGPQDAFVKIGIFFSKAAVVTFGGAYAVLAYVAQQTVENFGWLRPGEMLDGLGMAETTPGPLIQVVQFVGFMGAYRNPGALPPMLAGTLGAVLTTWVTYVPCFLWIFLGAPYVESLRASRTLGAALSAITAAVVGVILNLTVWFATHVLFADLGALAGPWGASLLVPVWSSVNLPALLITLAAFLAMNRFQVGMLPVLAASTLAGLLVWG